MLPLFWSLLAVLAADPMVRVHAIETRRTTDLDALVSRAGLHRPLAQVYLRGLKEERVLELWGADRVGAPLVLIKRYPFCAASGGPGPKREEGDLQVPEGLYEISEFNPSSNFHLSMKVSYPNLSDRVRGTKGRLGGLIYVHGNCASVGCIAIEDAPIEEVWLLAQESKARPLRIDLFPRALTAESLAAAADSPAVGLWRELAPAYAQFEATHVPPRFKIDGKTGAYVIAPAK